MGTPTKNIRDAECLGKDVDGVVIYTSIVDTIEYHSAILAYLYHLTPIRHRVRVYRNDLCLEVMVLQPWSWESLNNNKWSEKDPHNAS